MQGETVKFEKNLLPLRRYEHLRLGLAAVPIFYLKKCPLPHNAYWLSNSLCSLRHKTYIYVYFTRKFVHWRKLYFEIYICVGHAHDFFQIQTLACSCTVTFPQPCVNISLPMLNYYTSVYFIHFLMFSHFFLSLSVRLILRACTSLSRYAVLLQFPLCVILNSISITFSFSFCLFPVTVFPHIQQSECCIRTPQISPLSWIFSGETSPEYGIDSSFCYFSQNINIFHMSFQFFALCKCRSCSISVVILVW